MAKSWWRLLLPVLLTASAGAQRPLPDAGAFLQARDARLGAKPGTIVLDRPMRLASDVSLGVGHRLLVKAQLTVASGSVRLLGQNAVQCTAPVTVENATDLFVADRVTDVSVRGCDVTVTRRRGGYLLTATRSARVAETGNHLVGMAIFNTHNTGVAGSQTTDVTISGNSTSFPPGTGPIGIYLMYVLRGTVANNSLAGTGHGIEWWGGDANEGWHGFDAVTGAGHLSITGNLCHTPGGSCVWGSDGTDITVSGNTTDSCSDVCFDTEGGVRTTFTGNKARACANGCYAAEFESLNTVFAGNEGEWDGGKPGGVLVLIKHPSGRGPNHVNLQVTGNTLRCTQLCAAVYTEGEDGVTIANNTITNGFLQFINYTNDVTIRANRMRFTVPVGAMSAITGPSLYNGHRSVIADNTIDATAGENGEAACVSQGWSDSNNTDTMIIRGNNCSGFKYGIVTATSGPNPGAPHAVWTIDGNRFAGIPAAQQILHHHGSGNEVYSSQP